MHRQHVTGSFKFRFTASALWAKEKAGGRDSVSIRATSLILILAGGALLTGLTPMAPAGWLPPAAAASFPVATDSRIGGDENQTRFVVDLSSKVDLRAFTLADPYRVVVDLPQVVFQLKPKAGEGGPRRIKRFR
jgi:N-acetylmuramoyl-L-alanine amidase